MLERTQRRDHWLGKRTIPERKREIFSDAWKDNRRQFKTI